MLGFDFYVDANEDCEIYKTYIVTILKQFKQPLLRIFKSNSLQYHKYHNKEDIYNEIKQIADTGGF